MRDAPREAGNAEWMRDLRALIERRVGLLVDDHRLDNLRRSAVEACQRFGYADPPTLLRALSRAPNDAPVFEHLIANVTIGESHFFRDRAQMAFLQQEFLPRLIADRRGGSRTLRVWSAAASEGQELYSIAIMLVELIDNPDAWNLHLVGTDLNVNALRKALEGVYSAWSLRGLSETQRHRHFEPAGPAGPAGSSRLKPRLRGMARFSYLNLADDTFPSILNDLHAMDLILCRNVFIYFNAALVREILQRIVATLAPGGVLLLGASDLVDPLIPGLDIEMRAGMCFYRKPLAHASLRASASPPSGGAVVASAPGGARRPANYARDRYAVFAAVPATERSTRDADFLATLREKLAAQRWQDIAGLAKREPERMAGHGEAALAAARALSNLGQPDKALQWCELALPHVPTDPDAHFLHALLLLEAGRTEDALKAFRRALFLRPDFALAHYQYALLQLSLGRHDAGMRSLNNVRRLLADAPAERALPGAEHMSCGRLAQIIDNELSLHHESRPA